MSLVRRPDDGAPTTSSILKTVVLQAPVWSPDQRVHEILISIIERKVWHSEIINFQIKVKGMSLVRRPDDGAPTTSSILKTVVLQAPVWSPDQRVHEILNLNCRKECLAFWNQQFLDKVQGNVVGQETKRRCPNYIFNPQNSCVTNPRLVSWPTGS